MTKKCCAKQDIRFREEYCSRPHLHLHFAHLADAPDTNLLVIKSGYSREMRVKGLAHALHCGSLAMPRFELLTFQSIAL